MPSRRTTSAASIPSSRRVLAVERTAAMALQQPQGDPATAEPVPALQEHPAGGALPSPQAADADSVAAAPDSPSAMESLPDELLELILSLVPSTYSFSGAGLMRLRRVSRRWARVLCGAAVWRHRTLEVFPPTHRALLDPCVPVLDAVSLGILLDEHGADDVEAAFEALATTHCKIRCLSLMTDVNGATVGKWVPRILEQHRDRLQELNIRLFPQSLENAFIHADPIIATYAPMPELRTLSLEAHNYYVDQLTYCFSKVQALQRLSFGGNGVKAGTLESLLRANKDTLLEVDCGDYDVFHLLPQCSLLRKVTTSAMHFPASHRLAEVRGLRTLVASVYGSLGDGLRSLVSLLEGSPAVPAELELDVRGFHPQFTLLHAAPNLGSRLRSLRLCESYLHMSEAQLAAALCDLPRLELLTFWYTKATDWALVADAWTERTAPALRELHVHWQGKWNTTRSPAWVPRLQAARPALRICTSNNCYLRIDRIR